MSEFAHPAQLVEKPLSLGESELFDWGRRLGARLTPPRIIALSGELGAGKTSLVKAICDGYGVTESVTSPTFALIHRYQSDRGDVIHVDLYRLSGQRESAELGLEELLASEALILVEWPERAAGLFPAETIWLSLEHVTSDGSRRILQQQS